MFKKISTLSAVLAISCIALAEENTRITAIKNTLEHIQQQKKTIVTEMQQAVIFGQKVESHFQGLFQDSYKTVKEKCLLLLSTIIMSDEFTSTVEQVTDIQLTSIVEKGMNFDDIAIDPSQFPLEQKIQSELSIATFDEKSEQLFNAFYVMLAITHGSKALLKKLALVEMQLSTELQELQAAE